MKPDNEQERAHDSPLWNGLSVSDFGMMAYFQLPDVTLEMTVPRRIMLIPDSIK